MKQLILLKDGQNNTKLKKTDSLGLFKTYYMNLATYQDAQEFKLQGCCQGACEECIKYCLRNTGCYKCFEDSTAPRRIINSVLLQNNKEVFYTYLRHDLCAITSQKEKAAIRLHALGEYPYEKDKAFIRLANEFSQVMFYDYYKITSRKEAIDNYKLCFSNPIVYNSMYNEWSKKAKALEKHAYKMLESGHRVSFIFKNEVPDMWEGYQVINGDASDLFFMAKPGIIRGLKYKGNQQLF